MKARSAFFEASSPFLPDLCIALGKFTMQIYHDVCKKPETACSFVLSLRSSRHWNWKRGYGRALRDLKKLRPTAQCYGVYRGRSVMKDGKVNIVPCSVFLSELHSGNILK